MLWMAFVLTLSLVTIYILFNKWKYKKRNKLLSKIRAVPGWPIIGNTQLGTGTLEHRLQKMMKLCDEYDTPFVYWLMNVPAIFMSKMEDIQEMGTSCSHRSTLGLVEETFFDGIISQNYNKWKKTRKLMNPAFGPILLKQYLKVFNEQTKVMIELLREKCDTGVSFDMWPYAINANIDTITENIAGIKLQTQLNLNNEYSEAVSQILNLTIKRLCMPILHVSCIFKLYTYFTGEEKIIQTLHKLPKKALALAKEAEHQKKHQQKYPCTTKQANSPKCVADILLAARETDVEISEKQIQAELIHLIAAGSETTAITTAILLVMYALYPQAQEKAYQEIKTVLGQRQTVTMDDLQEMRYLEQCIKETLRVFTLVPITFRTTDKEISVGNKKIPADMPVLLILKAVHDNADYYKYPTQWNPDNFTPEAVDSRPKGTFVGFGVGQRACLGMKYAMISIKTQICYILSNFSLTTDIKYEDIEVIFNVIQRLKYGYPVILTSRKKD